MDQNQNQIDLDQQKHQLADELTCIICSSIFLKPTSLICGHTFCNQCIKKSLEVKPSCPVCRKLILIDPSNLSENITIRNTILSNQYTKELYNQRVTQSEKLQSEQDQLKNQTILAEKQVQNKHPSEHQNKQFYNLYCVQLLKDVVLFPYVGEEITVKLLNSDINMLKEICTDGSIICLPKNFKFPCTGTLCKIQSLNQSFTSSSTQALIRVMVLKKVQVDNIKEIREKDNNSNLQQATLANGSILEDDNDKITQKDIQFIKTVVQDFNQLLQSRLASNFTIYDLSYIEVISRLNNLNLLNLLATPPEQLSLIILQQLAYIISSFLNISKSQQAQLLNCDNMLIRYVLLQHHLVELSNSQNFFQIFKFQNSFKNKFSFKGYGVLILFLVVILIEFFTSRRSVVRQRTYYA